MIYFENKMVVTVGSQLNLEHIEFVKNLSFVSFKLKPMSQVFTLLDMGP